MSKEQFLGEDVGAVVFDVGTCTVKVGHAGDDAPRCVVDSVTGVDEERNVVYPLNAWKMLKGVEVHQVLKGDLTLDVSALEAVVEGTTSCQYGICSPLGEKAVMMIEPNFHSRPLREKYAEMMFERFGVDAFYLLKRGVAASFAGGRHTACAICLGASGGQVVAVHHGYSLHRSITKLPAGGDDVDAALDKLLEAKGHKVHPHFAHEKNADGEGIPVSMEGVHPSYIAYGKAYALRKFREGVCQVDDSGRGSEYEAPANQHQLPDGTMVNIAPMATTASEVLFDSQTSLGLKVDTLASSIGSCINASDVDIRRDIMMAVFTTGCLTATSGFHERVYRILHDDEMVSGCRYKLLTASSAVEKKFGAWTGGSITACLDSFQTMWVSKADFNEHGSGVCERKCLQ